MVPVPGLSQMRAIAVLRLPVAYVRVSAVGMVSVVALRCLSGGRRSQNLRLLRAVRVIRRHVDLQLGDHLAPEDALGEHAAHGLLDRERAVPREQVPVAFRLETAGDAGVPVVELL